MIHRTRSLNNVVQWGITFTPASMRIHCGYYVLHYVWV